MKTPQELALRGMNNWLHKEGCYPAYMEKRLLARMKRAKNLKSWIILSHMLQDARSI